MTIKKDFSAASRIASALVFGVVVSVLPNITAALCALFFSFLIIFLFPTDAKHLIKRWLQINLFILFYLAGHSLDDARNSHRTGEIFSYEGVYLSALVTVKANALFFVFYALVSLLSFSRLAAGLKSLKFSESLIVILLFCARGIDIFESEYRRMKEAAKLRGFEMKANKRTYQTVAAVIALLFVRAVRRSRVLDDAMKLRGFDGHIRTLNHEVWRYKDTFLLMLFCCASVVFAYLGWR